YDDPVDRLNLNKEMTALKDEINRIADSANFNGIKLLNGDLDPIKKAAADQAATDSAAASAFTDVTVTPSKDHETGKTSQKMAFTVDLTQFRATSTAAAGETVTVNFNGITFAGTAGGSGTVTWNTQPVANTTTVTIGGTQFKCTSASNGIYKFEAVSTPTAANSFSGSLAAAVITKGANTEVNQGENIVAHIDKEQIVGGLTKQAQGSFALTGAMVQDGMELKIGDTTYTFAVGKDSKVTGTNVVDLKDLALGADGNLSAEDLKTAAARLSGVANGKGDFIVTNDANSATISLTERLTSDGKPKYELEGPTEATKNDATWKTTDGKGVVQYGKASGAQTDGSIAGKLTLQIGDTSDSFNSLDVKIGDMHVSAMGIMDTNATTGDFTGVQAGKSINDIDIKTPGAAHDAIDVIKGAINYVSSIRGDLGAIQNRLEHTANNLSVMAENIQDAESTIRDTDVAEEMMAYTKNNILVQSAQAMLAQANAVPQGVLQLLG
uniref:flagellin n=1 Tax=Oscillibacter sp. TaxID=1945593 RepID=UPI002D804BD4